MTPTTSAVRAACKQVWGADHQCRHPDDCTCFSAPDVLTVLLANARAEGAAGERREVIEDAEQAVRYAFKHQEFSTDSELDQGYADGWENAAHVIEKAIRPHVEEKAAIRARDAKEAT